MRRFTNLGFVLKKKARIYAWLLLGFIPTWIYGATECYAGPDSTLITPLSLIAHMLEVTSLWIVIWRWEAIEQRKLSKRVRILLLGISYVAGFVVFGTFFKWSANVGSGMYLPIALSSAPLSAVLAIVRLGPDSTSALGQVLGTLQMLDWWAILWGTPAVWGTIAVLAASPRTRRRRRLFMGTILSHYLVGVMAIVLMTGEDWDCLSDVWRAVPEALAGWALVYIAAHVLLWGFFLRNRAKKDSPATAVIPAAPVYAGLKSGGESADVRDDVCCLRRS
jgi:hypothetical protein